MKKGISIMLLYGIVTMLIILVIIFGFFSYKPGKEVAKPPPEQQEISPTSSGFDYSKFILTSNDPYYFDSSNSQEVKDMLCQSLKRCIMKAYFKNEICEVGEIAFGDMSNPTQSFGSLQHLFSSCSGDIIYNISDTVSQKLCTLNPSSYGGDVRYSSDYDMELSYWDCSVKTGESVYPNIKHLYSSQYVYNGRDFGPGRLKIYLGRVNRSYSNNCIFNLYYCYLPTIAESENDPILGVFEYFRTLEIYPIDDIDFKQGGYWYITPTYSPSNGGGTTMSRDDAFTYSDTYGMHSSSYSDYYSNLFNDKCVSFCAASSDSDCIDNCMNVYEREYSPRCGVHPSSGNDVYCYPSERCVRYENLDESKCYHIITYRWSKVDINLKDKQYDPVVVINAIKDGLYENTIEYDRNPMLSDERHIWEGSWDILKDTSLTSGNCFPSVNMNSFTGRKIRYNCNGGSSSSKCDGNLTIEVAVKQVFDGPIVHLSTVVGVCDH